MTSSLLTFAQGDTEVNSESRNTSVIIRCDYISMSTCVCLTGLVDCSVDKKKHYSVTVNVNITVLS